MRSEYSGRLPNTQSLITPRAVKPALRRLLVHGDDIAAARVQIECAFKLDFQHSDLRVENGFRDVDPQNSGKVRPGGAARDALSKLLAAAHNRNAFNIVAHTLDGNLIVRTVEQKQIQGIADLVLRRGPVEMCRWQAGAGAV